MQLAPVDLLPAVRIVNAPRHSDERGFFSEVWHQKQFAEAGIDAQFLQDNHVLSRRAGTVRGMHFQVGQSAQGKLIRCIKGQILDVAVDIRRGSPTYARYVAVELNSENWRQLYIPPGFAHGYCTMTPDTEVIYKVTAYYDPAAERGFFWDDPEVNINWPVPREEAQLSQKDLQLPRLATLPNFFPYDRYPD